MLLIQIAPKPSAKLMYKKVGTGNQDLCLKMLKKIQQASILGKIERGQLLLKLALTEFTQQTVI